MDHDLLMARVAGRVRDKRVLRLIGRYLRAGVVLPDGRRERTPRGVPQGGPLSPLLANIMLTPLDRELEERGRRFARYADDFLVLTADRREAERARGEVVAFVEGELKLTVNAAKSRVDRLARCAFLGCRIERKQIRWSEAAVDEFRAEVRRLTSRTWGVAMERRLGSLGRYVQGWFGYYRISRTWGEVRELDKWLRRRVRQCYWPRKAALRPRGRFTRLADEHEQHRAGRAHERVVESTRGAGFAGALGRLSLPAAAEGGAGSSGDGRARVNTTEPPDADPQVRWCGGRGLITSGYPIRLFLHLASKGQHSQKNPEIIVARAQKM